MELGELQRLTELARYDLCRPAADAAIGSIECQLFQWLRLKADGQKTTQPRPIDDDIRARLERRLSPIAVIQVVRRERRLRPNASRSDRRSELSSRTAGFRTARDRSERLLWAHYCPCDHSSRISGLAGHLNRGFSCRCHQPDMALITAWQQ